MRQLLTLARYGRFTSFLQIALALLGMLANMRVCQAGNAVLYVNIDAPPGGDGLSWATALNDLEQVRQIADPDGGGATVFGQAWVVEGTYKPSIIYSGDPRKRYFILSNNLAYLGGFSGNESSADQRDPVAHPTILSGDINTPGNFADNCYHVVYTTTGHNPTAVMDGFTITGGNANADITRGGGWYNEGGKPTVINCRFEGNAASDKGAGMYSSSFPSITNCVFFNNTGPTQGAGGLHTAGSIVTGCSFENNSGASGGLAGASIATDCTFMNNASSSTGGGAVGGTTYRDCLFIGNTSTGGGGALNAGSVSQFNVINCVFIGNNGGVGVGGAIRADLVSGTATVMNCTFLGNTISTNGGAMIISSNTAKVSNCLFSGNHAQFGGGLYFNPGTAITISDCTFSKNTATSQGAGINSASNTTIDNCIVWGNSVNGNMTQVAQIKINNGPLAINYSTVQGWTGSLGGTGNNGLDPLFVNATGPDLIAGTSDDNLSLQPGSPCIDAGKNASVPADSFDLNGNSNTLEPLPIDLAGNSRFFDDPNTTDTGNGTPPLVDKGAFEFGVAPPPPDPGMFIGPDGGSWFIARNWAGNAVPDATIDVTIPVGVVINQTGAVAHTISIPNNGMLTIGPGTLDVSAIAVASAATLKLDDPSAFLDVDLLSVASGGNVVWNSGSLRINTSWTDSTSISIGCNGSASLILNGNPTITAPQISICGSGQLSGNGTIVANVSNGGQVFPGSSAGTIAINGNWTQSASGTLGIQVGGYVPGVLHDLLVVNGNAALNGTLDVTLLAGFQPQLAGVGAFLQAAQVTGNFSTVNLPTMPGTFAFLLQTTSHSNSLLTSLNSTAPRLYVRANAANGGDGQTWATATNTLQGALAVGETFPATVNEIWAAAGSYKPSRRTDENDVRTVTFQLLNGVAIYGGFAGNETSLEQRDPSTNITILSGDLAGNDIFNLLPNNTTINENAYHVVTGGGTTTSAVLDGFTIRSGNAINGSPVQGAGMLNLRGSPTISHCIFNWNQAIDGGAMANTDSNPAISSCTFDHNGAGITGCAIRNDSSNPIIQNCIFNANEAIFVAVEGSGIYNTSSSPDVAGCVFSANIAASALANVNLSNGTYTDCQFNDNTARHGAAVYTIDSDPTFSNCSFSNNTSAHYGGNGGAMLIAGGNSILTDCTFMGNTAGAFDGGAVRISSGDVAGGSPSFINCTFQGNFANHGGAVANDSIPSILFQDCKFTSNTASTLGGAVYDVDFASPTFENCQFSGNFSGQAGGGLYHFNDGLATLDGCTFANDSAPDGSGVFNRRGTIMGAFSLAGGDDFLNARYLRPGSGATPSAIGAITINGDYRHAKLTETGDLNPAILLDISGPIPGVQHDVLDVTGNVQIDGGIIVINFVNFAPKLGDTFDVISAASVNGQFENVGVGGAPAGLTASIEYGLTYVRATMIEAPPINFTNPPIIPILGAPTAAVMIDFNNDGYLDLALAVPGNSQFDPGNVLVFPNGGVDGNGQWLGFVNNPLVVPVGTQPASIAAGNLNGDAFADLVVGNRFDGTVSIIENLSGTGFLLLQNYPVGGIASSVAIGQLTGSAALDVAVSNETTGKIRIFRNSGNATFTAIPDLIAGPTTTSLTLADFDLDSKLDIAAVNSTNYLDPPSTLSIHTNLGYSSGFAAPTNYTVERAPVGVMATALTSNGLQDVITANRLDQSLCVFLNYAAEPGTFLPPIILPTEGEPGSMAAADLDGDGDSDLAFVVRQPGDQTSTLRTVHNDQGPDGELILAIGAIDTKGNPAVVLAADVDNDGDTDLVVVNVDAAGSGKASDLRGAASGSIEVLLHGTAPIPGDVNGDGHVNVDDLLAIINAWGPCPAPCPADLNHNGVVNVDDLLEVINHWG